MRRIAGVMRYAQTGLIPKKPVAFPQALGKGGKKA
jgi:hypothetical protein